MLVATLVVEPKLVHFCLGQRTFAPVNALAQISQVIGVIRKLVRVIVHDIPRGDWALVTSAA